MPREQRNQSRALAAITAQTEIDRIDPGRKVLAVMGNASFLGLDVPELRSDQTEERGHRRAAFGLRQLGKDQRLHRRPSLRVVETPILRAMKYAVPVSVPTRGWCVITRRCTGLPVSWNLGELAILHPGWVRTRMGGSSTPLSTQESVRGMLSLVDRVESGISGGFFRHDGACLPW